MSSKNRRKSFKNLQSQLSNPVQILHHLQPHKENCLEGDSLSRFLHPLQREITLELQSNKTFPEKLWFKQNFSVGVNEVTRLLERMAPSSDNTFNAIQGGSSITIVNESRVCPPRSSLTKLQVVLVASDCNSRWLTKHLPSLAASRNVPLIYVKDNKEGSLRLGEVVKVKTAMALGVKVKGSSINKYLEAALSQDKLLVNRGLDST
ncbi:unnamed protein product [Amaranthus hypochondriacus]